VLNEYLKRCRNGWIDVINQNIDQWRDDGWSHGWMDGWYKEGCIITSKEEWVKGR
jgi:hypothetical protein